MRKKKIPDGNGDVEEDGEENGAGRGGGEGKGKERGREEGQRDSWGWGVKENLTWWNLYLD